jgi:putative hemolysin
VEGSALENGFRLLFILGLILLNGFFVAAEYSIVTVRKTRIEQLVADGNAGARAVLHATQHLDRLVATVQLGVTVCSLGVGWLAEPALAGLVEPLLVFLPRNAAYVTSHAVATVIGFTAIAFLHLIIGEQVPKIGSLQNAEGISLVLARPVMLVAGLLRPVILLVNAITNALLRLLAIRPSASHTFVHSVEELRMLVEQSREAGFLEAEENDIAQRAFGLGELSARDVMVPRTEVAAVPATVGIDELMERVVSDGHSRFPVYHGSVDNVIGVVHVKDVVKFLRQEGRPRFNVRRVMRQPLFVPETLPANELLAFMRARRRHIAVAVDEYGGTAGIVTLEDILERLVGEVQDEFEQAEVRIQRQRDGSYLVNGLVNLAELSEAIGVELESEDYSTIGGYVFGLLGRRPEVGDEVRDAGRFTARVEALDGLRIAMVRIRPVRSATTVGGGERAAS